MKYMLMLYDNAGTRDLFIGEEGQELMAQVNAIMAELTESGELIGGEALAEPPATQTVRLEDGVPVVTDGPLAEAKEFFGGYLLVDVESIERAVRDRLAAGRAKPIEVRPLMGGGGDRDVTTPGETERLLRELAPQALGALVRRHRDFEACEDALQEALLAAAAQWPRDGVPEQPRAWLIAVAARRLVDEVRSDIARRRREERRPPRSPSQARSPAGDDTLALLLMCCHPALTPASQIALTLRAVGGLTTEQIAAAFLVPETTMAQRISRAKATIRADGIAFALPPRAAARPAPGRRAARAVPGLQRGLHGQLRGGAAARRAGRRGDPPDPAAAPAAAGRGRR